MISKRGLLAGMGGLFGMPGAALPQGGLPPVPMAQHEQAMRHAIEQGRKNRYWPYGAVIARASTGEIMATGTNDTRANPILHGEIVCINEYVRRHGNRDWGQMILYTTCEPCPMCMMALIWARIGGVVYASSSFGAVAAAIGEPNSLSARDIVEATPFYKPMLLGGVLAAETDAMFASRKRF